MSRQVAWGSLGANELNLQGQVGSHTGSALIKWSGNDVDSTDDYGLSFFKRISRGLKKVAKVARPLVNVTATGASLVFPPAAPLAGGVAAATNILAKLEKGTPNQKRKAKAIILGTAKAARRDAKKRIARRSIRRQESGGRWPKQARIVGTLTFSGDETSSERAHMVLSKVHKARKRAKAAGRRVAWVTSKTGFVYRVL